MDEGDGVRAVVTTGIYCSPCCSARPLPGNVRVLASAAAAEAAGFRACHRCRPYRDDRPPARSGPEIVDRAVGLIAAGALDGQREDALAAQLGISARHLRRMFVELLGATPDRIARSRRAHFARRLLDDTDLPITDIAFAAGFGSLRQFNREVAETFGAAPRDLRKRRRRADRLVADGGLALRLPAMPASRFERRLAELGAEAVPRVAALAAGRYRRTVQHGGAPGVVEICAGDDRPLLVVHLPRLEGLIHLVERMRRILMGEGETFEDRVRAVVGASTPGPAQARPVLGLLARLGAPVPGLGAFGLDRLFPEPRVLAGADLAGLGVAAPVARAVRELATAWEDQGAGVPDRSGSTRRVVIRQPSVVRTTSSA